MNLSPNFTLEEATVSETAAREEIDNTPSTTTVCIMSGTASLMEQVRSVLHSKGIHINSWYRSPLLNATIGSKPTSQHCKGEAVDFICPGFGTPLQICQAIIAAHNLVPFDQLILEHTWVHISFAIVSGQPRGQVLSLLSTGGYATGLTDNKGNNLGA